MVASVHSQLPRASPKKLEAGYPQSTGIVWFAGGIARLALPVKLSRSRNFIGADLPRLGFKESLMSLIKSFIRDEKGLETVEYAIIAGLIVVGTIATVAWIGSWVLGQFIGLQNDLSGEGAPPAP
jgi:Flp pilus assembly pilin Flp